MSQGDAVFIQKGCVQYTNQSKGGDELKTITHN